MTTKVPKELFVRLAIELKNPKPADMVLVTNLLFASQTTTWNSLYVADLSHKDPKYWYETDKVNCVKLSDALSLGKLGEGECGQEDTKLR